MTLSPYALVMTSQQLQLLTEAYESTCRALQQSSDDPEVALPVECEHRIAAVLIQLMQEGESDPATLVQKVLAQNDVLLARSSAERARHQPGIGGGSR